jgi:hypothetical protein
LFSAPPRMRHGDGNTRKDPGTRVRRNGLANVRQSPIVSRVFSNRQPGRLESVVTPRKQTAGTRLNRQLSGTSRIQLSSSGFGITRSRAAAPESRITSHELRARASANNVELAASAKKQQIRESNLNTVGRYFLVVYVQFQIGRQRALRHNGCTKVVRNYNDKNQAALVEWRNSRERQSVSRSASQRSEARRGYPKPSMGRTAPRP